MGERITEAMQQRNREERMRQAAAERAGNGSQSSML
jgi:heme exporter protein D